MGCKGGGYPLREGGGAKGAPLRLLALFARKYSAAGRPWFGIHHDESRLTVNVALSDDREGSLSLSRVLPYVTLPIFPIHLHY